MKPDCWNSIPHSRVISSNRHMEDTGVSGAEAGGIDIKTYFPFLRQFGKGGQQSVLANHMLAILRVSFSPVSHLSLSHTEKNEDATSEEQHHPDGRLQFNKRGKLSLLFTSLNVLISLTFINR